MQVQFPMFFKLTVASKGRSTHCGVLEFVAEEGKCYLPGWVYSVYHSTDHALPPPRGRRLSECGECGVTERDTLGIAATGDKVSGLIKSEGSVDDNMGLYRLQNVLGSFACLTRGDVISIEYNRDQYDIEVVGCKPQDAIGVIDTDVNLEFRAPKGYEEQQVVPIVLTAMQALVAPKPKPKPKPQETGKSAEPHEEDVHAKKVRDKRNTSYTLQSRRREKTSQAPLCNSLARSLLLKMPNTH